MKATISVPDETLRRVDEAARQLGVSRSESFARAAHQWLDVLDDDTTAAINEETVGAPSDRAFTDAAADAVR
jgi:metal-responsive CopG/Arc/MetJ family transcriptional regulator